MMVFQNAENENVATTLQNMAVIYSSLGDFEKGFQLYKKVLSMRFFASFNIFIEICFSDQNKRLQNRGA